MVGVNLPLTSCVRVFLFIEPVEEDKIGLRRDPVFDARKGVIESMPKDKH